MKIRRLWRLYPIFLVIGIILYFYITGEKRSTKFYRSKANCKVISSSNWQMKMIEFYLENGLEIHSLGKYDIDIEIGDSIVKNAKSWDFEIFKKGATGYYKFDKSYNYKDR